MLEAPLKERSSPCNSASSLHVTLLTNQGADVLSGLHSHNVSSTPKKSNLAVMLFPCQALVGNVELERTVVKVGALRAAAHTHVSALAQMVTSPTRRALVTAAADARLARRRALLATFLIVAEKAAGALRHAGPGEGERESDEGQQ